MAKDLELKLRITADGKVAVQALDQVEEGLDQAGASAREASASIGKFSVGTLVFNEVAEAVGRLAGSAEELAGLAEGFGKLRARLNLAVEGFGDGARALADVQGIADSLGAPLADVGELYIKLSGAAQTLGITQGQVAQTTKAFSQALTVAGATGAQATSALTQFSQAMASGVLRGEEFNAVYEAAPALMDQIAKGLGVATKDMRALAEAGALSASEVAAALRTQGDAIATAYSEMPETVEQAFNRVRNAAVAWLGEGNASLGITEKLAGAIGVLAEHMDTLGAGALALAAGGLTRLAQQGAATLRQTLDDIRARKAQMEALAAQSAAERAAATEQAALAARKAGYRAQEMAQLAARAQAEQVAALASERAAAQQLAAMAQLSIFGERRAAAERQLAAAVAMRQAADAKAAVSSQVAANAQRHAALSSQQAAAAMAASGASAGILTRALGLLGGPVGVLLTVAASFAAFTLAAGDAEAASVDLGRALAEQGERIDELGKAGLETLIQGHQDYQRALREEIEVSKARLAQMEEEGVQAGLLAELTRGSGAALNDYLAEKARLAADVEAKEKALAKSSEDLSGAYQRLSERTERLAKADAQRRLSAVATLKALADERQALEDTSKASDGYLGALTKRMQTARSAAQAGEDVAGALRAEAAAAAVAQAQAQAALATAERNLSLKERELAALRAKGEVAKTEAETAERERQVLAAALEARRADVEAARQQEAQARQAIATHGDQSDQLARLYGEYARLEGRLGTLRQAQADAAAASADLVAASERARASAQAYTQALISGAGDLEQLHAEAALAAAEVAALEQTMLRGAEAAAQYAQSQARLAELGPLIADAARDAAAGIDLQIAALGRELEIGERRQAVAVAELQLEQQRAQARGDGAEAARIAIDLMEVEVAQAQASVEAKRQEAAALAEKARFTRIAAEATGDYSREERAAVQALEQAAQMAQLEAQAMTVGAQAKREAMIEAERLATQQRVLGEAMREAGITGVQSMEEVRAALARAATSGELEALARALREAFAQGVLGAEEYQQALDQVRGKQQQLKEESRSVGIDMQRVFDEVGTDYGRFVQMNQGLREIPGALQKAWADYVAWMGANKDALAARVQAPQLAAAQPLTTTGRLATAPPVAIHIAGVLDVNDRATLEGLGRKLQPILGDLLRRGF